MRKAGKLVAIAAVVAAGVTIWFQHEQNRQLIQELDITRQEKANLESLSSSASPTQTQSEIESNKTEELQSELLRLRAAATRAARAEAEIAELKRELARARSRGNANADFVPQNPDTLTTYLGTHVDAPANLDPLYTKEGLASAIQLAAQKAGISLRKVTIDDSEYPFLTGVVTEPGDWPKLTEQLKLIDGYEFHGSVGNDTSHTLCTVPSRAYPAESAQNITRRMNSRLELFYNSFTAGQN
jgi:hypothetical protein